MTLNMIIDVENGDISIGGPDQNFTLGHEILDTCIYSYNLFYSARKHAFTFFLSFKKKNFIIYFIKEKNFYLDCVKASKKLI